MYPYVSIIACPEILIDLSNGLVSRIVPNKRKDIKWLSVVYFRYHQLLKYSISLVHQSFQECIIPTGECAVNSGFGFIRVKGLKQAKLDTE